MLGTPAPFGAATERWRTSLQGEELAYVVLEEARLLCESLAERAAPEEEWLLRVAHRDLGLAGYAASDQHVRAARARTCWPPPTTAGSSSSRPATADPSRR